MVGSVNEMPSGGVVDVVRDDTVVHETSDTETEGDEQDVDDVE